MDNYIVEKLTSISEKLGGIDQKIDYIKVDFDDFKSHIKKIYIDLNKIVTEIDNLKKYNDTQDDKIEHLQYLVSDIEDRIYKLSRYIDKFSYREKLKLQIYLKFKHITSSTPFKFVTATLMTAFFLTFVALIVDYLFKYFNIESHYISLFKEFLK